MKYKELNKNQKDRMKQISSHSYTRRRDVGEFCGGKTGECVVCCHRCGAFLMESASTTSYMVCPECGARLVVCVKKGKVSVFNDTRSEEELAKKRHA